MKKGLFWVVNHDANEPTLITKSVECNVDGTALENVEYTSKSGENFNHKIEWGKFGKEITKGKEYNYFPRGRVEINKGRITVFLNTDINSEDVINKVIEEFGLQDIENIRIVADGSRHYEYHRRYHNGMFDYEFKINKKIINVDSLGFVLHLVPPQLIQSNLQNRVYWFGYAFNSDVDYEQRNKYIHHLKGLSDSKSHSELVRFISQPLIELSSKIDLHKMDCLVYPGSGRSKIVTEVVKVINNWSSREINRASYELDTAEFAKVKGKNILVVDDINTSESTLNEIIRVLTEVNSDCSIYVYALIGNSAHTSSAYILEAYS